jgi:NTE family protein
MCWDYGATIIYTAGNVVPANERAGRKWLASSLRLREVAMAELMCRDEMTGAPQINLVFEGGGVKGVGLVGALAVLEERGFRVRHVAGASAGSMVAVLLAAGYSASELLTIAQTTGFKDLRDRDWVDRIPLLGGPISIFKDHGIYEGDQLTEWMRSLLAERGIKTFGDLSSQSADARSVFRHVAQVIVSDLTDRSLLVLPRDAHKLGIDPDELDVALAVRMSVSIPIFFEPVRFTNPRTGRQHVLVDGGLLSNFPVWLFDDEEDAGCPTLGIRLDEEDEETRSRSGGLGLESVLGFVKGLAHTAVTAHDRHYLERSNFDRTIGVPSLGVSTTDFDLSPAASRALYESGRLAAEAFLDRWEGWQVAVDCGQPELIAAD